MVQKIRWFRRLENLTFCEFVKLYESKRMQFSIQSQVELGKEFLKSNRWAPRFESGVHLKKTIQIRIELL